MTPFRSMLLGLAVWSLAGQAGAQIEGLSPPKPARPPSVDRDHEAEQDLENKREDRHRRDRLGRPKPTPYLENQQKALLKETLTPHERWLLLELSLVFCGAQTSGDKQGYTCEPTTHFNAFVRKDGKDRDGRIGLWFGARVAPFVGGGFYKDKPGNYGLTYFGPMIGVGKIDPVPEDEGRPRASAADGDVSIPSASGWVVTAGIAAVTRAGKNSDPTNEGSDNDFETKGLTFDSPGLWLEARYLHIAYGALGLDGIAGVQSGKDKIFVYGGVGLAAWD